MGQGRANWPMPLNLRPETHVPEANGRTGHNLQVLSPREKKANGHTRGEPCRMMSSVSKPH